jgi:hypothetical protein
MRSALAAAGCATGGSIGYVVGGPVVAAAGLIVAVGLGAAVTVTLWAMFGGHDPRSPFVRLMLIICVITGRRPEDYLPSQAGVHDLQASALPSAGVGNKGARQRPMQKQARLR